MITNVGDSSFLQQRGVDLNDEALQSEWHDYRFAWQLPGPLPVSTLLELARKYGPKRPRPADATKAEEKEQVADVEPDAPAEAETSGSKPTRGRRANAKPAGVA